jgi:hypothetical protein
MRTGTCYQCGRRLVDAVFKPVSGVDRLVDGNPVRVHKCCAKSFDEDQRREVPDPWQRIDPSSLGGPAS